MATRFEVEDERGFAAAAEELVEGYREWAAAMGAEVDPEDARIALDWKFSYADGRLTRWDTADLGEFLLDWCPRKVSLPSSAMTPFVRSVGTFFTFLAARGLLAGSGPEQLRRFCERNVGRFTRAMADTSRHGMAKSLLGGLGGLDDLVDGSPESLDELRRRIEGLSPDTVDELLAGEPPTLGPVRTPSDDERVSSATHAPILRQMRLLHRSCAAPGRALTQKGNLRLADARELVELLETGDPLEPVYGSLRSATELPGLAWLVEVALAARVVRRLKGRLVAVAAWEALGPLEALDRLVDAGLVVGLGGPPPGIAAWEQVAYAVETGWAVLLTELIEAEVDGEAADLDDAVAGVSEAVGYPEFAVEPILAEMNGSRIRRQVHRLQQLGVLTQDDVERIVDHHGLRRETAGSARLTPAGVAIAVRLLEQVGVTVSTRPDPVRASARELLALVDQLPPEQWHPDVRTWAATRGDDAAGEFGAELADGGREATLVLAVLSHLGELFDDAAAVTVVEQLLGGRWDGLAVTWLAAHGVARYAEADPARALVGAVDVLAVALDVDGPEAVIETFGPGATQESSLAALERMWRLDHDRVAEVLEVIGRHHPQKVVAKHARKMLAKYRSRG